MCGIAGWYRDVNAPLNDEQLYTLQNIIPFLITSIEERGKDAAGIGVVNKDNKIQAVTKRCVPGSVFAVSKALEKVVDNIGRDTRAVFLHSRLGTHGPNTQINAHPYYTPHIIGTHNGVINNYRELEKKVKDRRLIKGETDSARLWGIIQSNLQKESTKLIGIRDAIKESAGTAALAFMDLQDKPYLYLFRDGNPLHIFYDKETRTLFWASTERLGRESLELFDIKPALKNHKDLPVGKLLRFNSDLFNEESAIYDGQVNGVYTKSRWNYQGGFNNRSKYYPKKTTPPVKKSIPHSMVLAKPGDKKNVSSGIPRPGIERICQICSEEIEDTWFWVAPTYNSTGKDLCGDCYLGQEEFIALLGLNSYRISIEEEKK